MSNDETDLCASVNGFSCNGPRYSLASAVIQGLLSGNALIIVHSLSPCVESGNTSVRPCKGFNGWNGKPRRRNLF
jgi:hypothetical protein